MATAAKEHGIVENWRFYRPPAETHPAVGDGPRHSWKCRCGHQEVHWFGPESMACWICGQPGVRR